jgi:nitroimidazol reductase NimA-like FMN-containing flavoprotein (pyridoxamine 5'-phosphate oxidase superfamily)
MGKPDIYPVNFLSHSGVLIIRTNPGTKLAGLVVSQHVAFEVDEINEAEAWSVVLEGTARVVEAQSEVDELDKLPLRPWIPTRKYTYVEITPTRLHGRYFELGPEPERY